MALVSGPTLADAIADPNNELTRLLTRENDDAKLIDDLFLRILNRPATSEEITTCRNDLQSIDDDHRKLAENLGKRKVEFALRRPQLERDRLAAITSAQVALAAYEKDLAPRLSLKEKDKAARTAKLEADLKAYEATIPGKLADWEQAQAGAIINHWAILEPKSLAATGGASLTKEADGSITVGRTNAKRSRKPRRPRNRRTRQSRLSRSGMKTMSETTTSATWLGWRIAYWTNVEAAGWPWLVERGLTDALPGARVQVIPDREVDALSITPPEGTDPGQTSQAVELATRAIERVHHSL